MPLTSFQAELGRLLAANRTEDSYLAGAAPILAEPRTRRFSQDLDYFQDTPERVASAFAADRETLLAAGCVIEPELSQPGYIRVLVRRGAAVTKVEWAYDSSWRFLPVIASDAFGYQLHPIDLAVNKVLALAGRDEPRDLLDTLYCHARVLSLGALTWAAVGKVPRLLAAVAVGAPAATWARTPRGLGAPAPDGTGRSSGAQGRVARGDGRCRRIRAPTAARGGGLPVLRHRSAAVRGSG